MIRVGCAFALNGVAATVWLAATPALAARFDTSVGGLGITFVAARSAAFSGRALCAAGDRPPRGGSRTHRRRRFRDPRPGSAARVRYLRHSGGSSSRNSLAGLADGVSDVSMNVEAVAVYVQAWIPIVNRLHAVWSMGAVAGGPPCVPLAATGTSVSVHMLVGAATVALLNLGTLPLVRTRPRRCCRWAHRCEAGALHTRSSCLVALQPPRASSRAHPSTGYALPL